MTDSYTIDTLSNMTMVEIMEKMNHYRELSISNHNDKIELIKKNDELLNEINKLTNPKPKRKQIRATKAKLLEYLGETESLLKSIVRTNYSNGDNDEILTIVKICDGRFNKKVRPSLNMAYPLGVTLK